MIQIEYLPLVLTGLGLAASIIYYANVIHNANKMRQRDMIFQRFQGYSLDYFRAYNNVALQVDWETPEEYFLKYSRYADPEAASQFQYINRLFSLAGVMYIEGIADLDLIFQLYPATSVVRLWEQFKAVREYQRTFAGYPESAYKAFGVLYEEAKKRLPDLPSRRSTYDQFKSIQSGNP